MLDGVVRPPSKPIELVSRVFRASDVLRRGILTPAQLRSGAWRRLFHGVYADADLPDDHLLRCHGAALVVPPQAALTGRSAACLRGLPLGEKDEPVEVVVPRRHRFGPVAGLRVRTVPLPPGDVTGRTVRVTTPIRTAWEIARGPDLTEAVVGLDVLLGHGYVDRGQLHRRAAQQPRSRAALAVSLVDGRAESPQESRLRVALVREGLPRPEAQFVVRHRGQFVARVDLAWPERRVAVEYDGVWHADASQLRTDRARLNRLVDAGWLVLHVTARDLHAPERFATLASQLRTALARH